ncbi:DUF2892 domain-containing protein [Thiocapsa sp.]|uniref:YgaP family membrane protein n=1 Tax=Thiocapsa sp. TaxID=2024551 RepID=UPI003594534C
MTMTKNIGDTDRTIRLIAGLLLIFWSITAGNGMAFIGIYLLATVYFRTDPIYGFLGWNIRASSEDITDGGTQKMQVEQQPPVEEQSRARVEAAESTRRAGAVDGNL